jgi:DNA-binding transcriptional regulator GbsR (MarR family)
MKRTFKESEEELVERVVELFEMQGYNPTVMRIYVLLFLSTKPMGLKEISERTGYSVSTVCNMMEIVERTMDVRKFKKPGSKRVYYECLHDLCLIHKKKMGEAMKEASAMVEILRESEEMLKDETDGEAVIKRGHITRLRTGYERFHEMFHSFEGMIDTIKAQNG